MHRTAPTRRRALRSLLVLVLAAGVMAGCWPSVGTNFDSVGPFSQVSVRQDSVNTYYWPTNLGSQNRKHPVVLWGNGTFLNPTNYDGLLRHLASHGFIVGAANTSNAASGQEMLAGLDNLTTFNSDPASPFYQKVDLARVAAMGHSQGGGGAINAGADARVDTVVAIQPWLGTDSGLHGPTLYLAGEADTLISPASVLAKYNGQGTRIPAAYAELAGADHLQPIGNGNGYRGPVTAWLRWQLMGDRNARDQFVGPCAYCTSALWSDYRTNAPLQALAG
jgi:pimeloyl-ACP methyl ester carboxylesterase